MKRSATAVDAPMQCLRVLVVLLLGIAQGCAVQARTEVPDSAETPNAVEAEPAAAPAGYWDALRVGTNLMTRAPSAERFDAAGSLGVDFVRLTPSKWSGEGRDFLLGDADRFEGIPAADLAQLRRALDQAHDAGLRVVLTMLSLPGARWRQHNGDESDPRLWTDLEYHRQSAAFWTELASGLRGHPAVIAYNPINEPYPEVTRNSSESVADWAARIQGSAADLNRLYATLVGAIRSADRETAIVLDAANYASPDALPRLAPVADQGDVLYSFHFYEPWEYTTWRRNQGETSYPSEGWNQETLRHALEVVGRWQRAHGIPPSRILLGEFGCDRRISGANGYLHDVTQLARDYRWHWAFYSFREDGWDGMDYELGSEPLPWRLREARDRGEVVELPRGPNPLLQVLVDAIEEVRSQR